MADAAVRVLVIDDDRDDFLILQGLTRDSSLRLDHIDNYADGLTAIARREHDVYLVDFRIGSENGIELMTAALHAGCDAPIILLTGSTDPEVDRGAMLAGAADFLAKGRIDGPLLQRTIRYAVERKRHEKELRAMTAHAEAASRIKGDFLARMSHEIRTPMNAILGMTEVVLETELTALQREFLESVRMASQSLRALLNDILDFEKAASGHMEVRSSAFDLAAQLLETMGAFRASAAAKGIDYHWHIAADVPAQIVADPMRLRQTLSNLVGNALKFTDRGHIHVRVLRDTRDAADGSTLGREALRFEVEDTGVGIRAHNREEIFDAFTQADESLTRSYAGTGLGLAICKQLVELAGGRIWVDSQFGVGSTFTFTLPYQRLPTGARVRPPTPAAAMRAISMADCLDVLVVEDNMLNQRLMQVLLSACGHRVALARNGVEAVAETAARKFDLVLMDMQMPEMDGYEASTRIRAREVATGGHVPIIAMTAHALAGDRDKCIEAGADDYVSKPIDRATLLEAIARTVPKPV